MSVVIQIAGGSDVWTDTINHASGFTAVQNADGSVTLTPTNIAESQVTNLVTDLASRLKLAAGRPTSSASPGNPNEYWFDTTGLYLYQVSGASTGWRIFSGATF